MDGANTARNTPCSWCRSECSVPLEFHFGSVGAAEQVRQTRWPPEQCFEWDGIADLLLEYHLYRFMPARTSRSGRKKELQRSENEHILSMLTTAAIAWTTINLTSLSASLIHTVPGGMKPPMDTYLHECRHEVNQNSATMPGLKQRIVLIFWPPI